MLNANIVDHIGSKVTVWTKDGNAAENRQLHTVDEFGLAISNQDGKRTFIPWCHIKYVDYVEEKQKIIDHNQIKQNEHALDALTYASILLKSCQITKVGVNETARIEIVGKDMVDGFYHEYSRTFDIAGPFDLLISKGN